MAIPIIAAAASAGRATLARGGAAAARGMPGRLGDMPWQATATWDLVGRIKGEVLPQFQHACTVVVRGGPDADLRRVWYLCASIAFGRMKRSPSLVGGSAAMQATWDVSGKACQIELVYQAASIPTALREFAPTPRAALDKIADAVGNGIRSVVGIPTDGGFRPLAGRVVPGLTIKSSPLALIQLGPDQITIGQGWPEFLRKGGQTERAEPQDDPIEGFNFLSQSPAVARPYRVIVSGNLDRFPRNLLREWPIGTRIDAVGTFAESFVPLRYKVLVGTNFSSDSAGASASAGAAPTLPDDGRIITTGEKTHPSVQPPRPLIDGSTRTSLVSLVAAALHQPCFLAEAPSATNVPVFSSGVFVHNAGEGLEYGDVSRIVNLTRGQFTVNGADESGDSGVAPDGTAIPAVETDFRAG